MIPPSIFLCAIACWAGVNAIPATTTAAPPSFTLYGVGETVAGEITFSGSGTTEFDITVLGVSTDSAGTETTYSIGEYVSLVPASITATAPNGVGTVTETALADIETQNLTMVESSAGEWASFSAVVQASLNRPGLFQSCSFASDRTESPNCSEVIYAPTSGIGTSPTLVAFTTTFEGIIIPLTVLAEPTTSSTLNAANSNFRCSTWQMGGFIMFLVLWLL
ncbi:hypothetical protein BT96DRAFT_630724 [Gymnopus androsaceus JB14]|uniref:Reelin domain-containing protein n=1 Tax=Gymnopus androsaceus JB14 TaxID=1447944 RepID=A0A6A4HVC0_9AGAR|nr:hypothetical protein BT96DRAFT_630724 [Gymnopus androsaceus JB14]